MRKLLLLLIPLMVLNSCEDVIDVDLNKAASRLVVDARLVLRQDFTSNSVKLTRSSGFFDERNPAVTDAMVTVTDGNGIVYEFTYSQERETYFNSEINIVPNLDYTLQIIDGQDTYTSTQQLVTTVPLEDVEQQEVTGFGEFTQITAYFRDPDTLGNNYLFTYDDPENFQVDVSDDQFINGNRTPTSTFVEDLAPGTNITLTIMGIDDQALRFYETLIQQTADGGGGPFDTQPATVRGNVINVSNTDNFPYGYFMVGELYALDYVSE